MSDGDTTAGRKRPRALSDAQEAASGDPAGAGPDAPLLQLLDADPPAPAAPSPRQRAIGRLVALLDSPYEHIALGAAVKLVDMTNA